MCLITFYDFKINKMERNLPIPSGLQGQPLLFHCNENNHTIPYLIPVGKLILTNFQKWGVRDFRHEF